VHSDSQQLVNCIFCGAGAPSEVAICENGFNGRQCCSCGLIFISPRPSFEQIVEIYGHDSAHVSSISHLAAGFSKRLYARNSLRIIRKLKASGDILEIGAGGGFFLDEARNQGFNPYAIEFNGIQANHIRDTLGIPCVAKSLGDNPYPGMSFDVIYHCDVVSHFYDPIDEFQAIHHSLEDDGLLVFETGNLGDVDHRYFRLFSQFQYPDHLFFFSTRNIRQLLESTGFELLEIRRYATLADLWVSRIRAKLRLLARSVLGRTQEFTQLTDSGIPSQRTHDPELPSGRKRSMIDWIKTADQYVNYLIRYRIGRLLPKGSRPQTLIVVARKRPFVKPI
jgi:SAM-dependent methyltransferase